MGLAIYVTNATTNETTTTPIAGNTELESLWKPIIRQNVLSYLDYIVTAGLSLDSDNHLAVRRQLQVLLAAIETQCSIDEKGSPAARCKRLFEIASSFDPNSSNDIYIG
jgi:hypothetical protein